MSIILEIIKAKPNPISRDKSHNIPKVEQLLGEWIDIKNIGTEAIIFSDISLSHTKFNKRCEMVGTECFWIGKDNFLQSGQIVRVHIGNVSDEKLIKHIDKANCDWHSYADREDFVLNNRCGDTLTLTWRDSDGHPKADTASYDKNQLEGAVLIRVENKLVDASSRPD